MDRVEKKENVSEKKDNITEEFIFYKSSIQGIITRLSHHSYGMNAISVAFTCFACNIMLEYNNRCLLFICIIMICVLSYISCHYLKLERYYREIDKNFSDEYLLDFQSYIDNKEFSKINICSIYTKSIITKIYFSEIALLIVFYYVGSQNGI